MNPVELQPHELMQLAANFFETHGIHYHVVGSMASMAYGEPRFTNDVDIVAELTLETLPQLYAAFPAANYDIAKTAARDAVIRCSQFNIIHPASGLKVDVIVPPRTEFAQFEKSRVRRITGEQEYSVWFASPEDVLLNKLIYYQLNCEEFANLAEARWFARQRLHEHNEERPHSSLGYQTPSAFAAGCANSVRATPSLRSHSRNPIESTFIDPQPVLS